jgi:Ca2+/Na+ antiporter
VSTKLEFKDLTGSNKILMIGGLGMMILGVGFMIAGDILNKEMSDIAGLQIVIMGLIITAWGTIHAHLDKMVILKSRHDN